MKSTLYAILTIAIFFVIAMFASCSESQHFNKRGYHKCLVMHKPVHKQAKGVACQMAVNH